MRSERGFTLVELLVSMASFLVIFGAITTIVSVAIHNQDRIADRVSANQRARPVMTRVTDQLKSACVAQRVAPIQAGSSGTQIRFLSSAGSTVTPTPDLRVVSLSGTSLTEAVYPATSGQPPSWTFAGAPSSTNTLMTEVAAPGGTVFRYYDYQNGRLSTTPLATPLDATAAARAALVTVAFTVAQEGGASSSDPKSPITISDAVDLRLESAGQFPTQENLPCQ